MDIEKLQIKLTNLYNNPKHLKLHRITVNPNQYILHQINLELNISIHFFRVMEHSKWIENFIGCHIEIVEQAEDSYSVWFTGLGGKYQHISIFVVGSDCFLHLDYLELDQSLQRYKNLV